MHENFKVNWNTVLKNKIFVSVTVEMWVKDLKAQPQNISHEFVSLPWQNCVFLMKKTFILDNETKRSVVFTHHNNTFDKGQVLRHSLNVLCPWFIVFQHFTVKQSLLPIWNFVEMSQLFQIKFKSHFIATSATSLVSDKFDIMRTQ